MIPPLTRLLGNLGIKLPIEDIIKTLDEATAPIKAEDIGLVNYHPRDTYFVTKLAYITGLDFTQILGIQYYQIKFEQCKIEVGKRRRWLLEKEKKIDVTLPKEVLAELKHFLDEEKGVLSLERCFFTNLSNNTSRDRPIKEEDIRDAYRAFRYYFKQIMTDKEWGKKWLKEKKNE